MQKNNHGTSFNKNLMFFKTNLTQLNAHRLSFNRNRNCVKYFVDEQQYAKTLAPVTPFLGVISFSLYAIRFAINLSLLIQLALETQTDPKKSGHDIRDLYYSLFNDLLWGTCNLTQFFWWTFAVSSSAGLKGLQLEAMAQLLDLLIMIIRYQETYQDHHAKLTSVAGVEQTRLLLEWHYKHLHFIRSSITAASILSAFSLLAFSTISAPISPIIFLISLCGAIARVSINLKRDSMIKEHLPSTEETRRLAITHNEEINQIMIDYLFFPISLYIIISAPISLTLIGLLSLIMIQQVIASFIMEDRENKSCAVMR